ncbi:hypothetical protein V8E51_012114 [Hyaloscypha variabilis]
MKYKYGEIIVQKDKKLKRWGPEAGSDPDMIGASQTPLGNAQVLGKEESGGSGVWLISAPVSRGNITLQSNSISDAPVINLNYFQAETNQKIAIYALKQLRKILAYPALAAWGIGLNNGEFAPGQTVRSDAEILE